MKNRLVRNTFYLYLMTGVKMIFPLITLPYLTRVLSVNDYGFVAYVKTFTSYIQLVLDFGFLLSATKTIAILFANKSTDQMEKIGRVVGDTTCEKAILAFLAGIVTILSALFIPILQENFLFTLLYYISCVITIFLPDYLYRGIERMEYVAVPYTAAKTVVVVLTILLVKNDSDLLLIPLLEIAGNSVAAFVSLFFFRKLDIRISVSGFRKWLDDLIDSGIYFVSNFATSLFGAMTTIVVGIYMSKSNVAYWSICMQIVSAAKAMYSPIANSVYPYMVTNKDMKLIHRIVVIVTGPMILGTVIVLFFGKKILMVIGGSDYGYAGYVLKFLLPVLIASFYSMLYGWPVLGAIGKIRETTVSTIIAALIQIIGIFILVLTKNFNLITLAICCSISETFLLVIRYYIFIKARNDFIEL
ncbi:oligosaccharide flippase family protein [Lactiplantibacillus plantarum]|uniref:oligosaccharide flippase family protein n=1 Tax=Lactiplantibacillus plantarum TaxID=1590 RepID=UPI00076025F8|nr:oligosaccharide flippase family protein [Lactiplantibacillus plantarum]KWT43286.1 sugar isomerase [Lactiplantibacillus plantarum]